MVKKKKEIDIRQEQIFDFINIIKTLKDFSSGLKIQNGIIRQSLDVYPHIVFEYQNPIFENKSININNLENYKKILTTNFKKTNKNIIQFNFKDKKEITIINKDGLSLTFKNVKDLYLDFNYWFDEESRFLIFKNKLIKNENLVNISEKIEGNFLKQILNTIPSIVNTFITITFETRNDGQYLMFSFNDRNKEFSLKGMEIKLTKIYKKFEGKKWYLEKNIFKLIKLLKYPEFKFNFYNINNNNRYACQIICSNPLIGIDFVIYGALVTPDIE